jgi:hypothetical protein
MSDPTKNIVDVILTVIGGVGALIAFTHTLRTWKEGQRWQRADKLDKMIDTFEKEPILRLACLVVDWTFRKTEVDGKPFSFTNEDALLALRLYGDGPGQSRDEFSPAPAKIRDAYDALLTFFSRLDVALEAGLIDQAPTRRYFVYWLEILLTMKHHQDETNVLVGQSPAQAVAGYIGQYGNPRAIENLARAMGLNVQVSPIASPNVGVQQPAPSPALGLGG